MIPPTSIDGTDIVGATIDGTDVTEITVDGQTVFSATQLPVAYNNLVAWYPFDSSFYGGANADDVTAILGGSGDDTAFDGTVNGATYQSSGGVTDINTGPNSGAFDFDGSNDKITLPPAAFDSTSTFTLTFWMEADDTQNARLFNTNDNDNGFRIMYRYNVLRDTSGFEDSGNFVNFVQSPTIATNTPAFVAVSFDDTINEAKAYLAASSVPFTNYDTVTTSGSGSDPEDPTIGGLNPVKNDEFFNGAIDDVRIYDTALSQSQIQTIYNKTKP